MFQRVVPRGGFLRVLALPCAALLALALTPAADEEETLPIPTRLLLSCESVLLGPDVEGDLNCHEVWFPRLGVQAIVQNDAPHDPGRSALMRRLAKGLTRALLVDGSGLSTYHEAGLLGGIEFDWFFPGGGGAPTPSRLPYVASFVGLDENGVLSVMARVYAYDSGQYLARKAQVEASVGHPLEEHVLWADDVVCNGLAVRKLDVSGHGNRFFGYAASAGSVEVRGEHNVFVDGLGAAGEILLDATTEAPWQDALLGGPDPWPGFDLEAARQAAQASGTYSAGKLSVDGTGLPPAAVIFAEGTISVVGDGLTGCWTFVSAAGTVNISGSDNTIAGYADGIVVVTYGTGQSVSISGDRNRLSGETISPAGALRVSGIENVLHGTALTAGVQITGSDNVFTDGTHPIVQLP